MKVVIQMTALHSFLELSVLLSEKGILKKMLFNK